MDIQDILILVLVLALSLVAIVMIPRWLVRRAARQVIKVFRKHNATDSKTARTIDELGLRPPGFFGRIGRLRDYKPHALNVLMQAEIIRQTEDGKLYLSEAKLAESNLETDASPHR